MVGIRSTLSLAGATLLAFALARPAAAQFGTNLIVNGNAESGTGSASGNDVVAIPGWTTAGNFTVVQYNSTNGGPSLTSPGPMNRGANYFSGGPDNALSSATQTVTLTSFAGLASLIDAGRVSYTLSGYLGGYDGQNDNATLTAQFLGTGMTPIGSAVLSPFFSVDRDGVTGLLFETLGGAIPVGTQAVQFTLLMTRTDGAYNDASADNLSFVLAGGATTSAPEPATFALVGVGVFAAGVVARRRRA